MMVPFSGEIPSNKNKDNFIYKCSIQCQQLMESFHTSTVMHHLLKAIPIYVILKCGQLLTNWWLYENVNYLIKQNEFFKNQIW